CMYIRRGRVIPFPPGKGGPLPSWAGEGSTRPSCGGGSTPPSWEGQYSHFRMGGVVPLPLGNGKSSNPPSQGGRGVVPLPLVKEDSTSVLLIIPKTPVTYWYFPQ
ncbi:hypothetical protein OTU49_008053, partial [Cherax quadricarinatus]